MHVLGISTTHTTKKWSTTSEEGKIGESGIFPNILDFGRQQIMWRTSRPCEH